MSGGYQGTPGLTQPDIYKEISTRFQSLREIQYKLPGIFSALVGGLWYFGTGEIDKDRVVALAVFVFAAAAGLACINAMYRFRAAFNGYLDKLDEFEGAHKVNISDTAIGISVNRGMVLLLSLTVLISMAGAVYALLKPAPGTTHPACQVVVQQPGR